MTRPDPSSADVILAWLDAVDAKAGHRQASSFDVANLLGCEPRQLFRHYSDVGEIRSTALLAMVEVRGIDPIIAIGALFGVPAAVIHRALCRQPAPMPRPAPSWWRKT